MIIEKNFDNFFTLNWLNEFLVGHKGAICGGCFKNIFNGEKVKDLDVFFKSFSDWYDAVDYFDRRTEGFKGEDKEPAEYRFYYENENVKAYKHIKTGVVVELCCKIFGTAREILDSFDFTLTKFAVVREEEKRTDGEDWDDWEEGALETKVYCDDKFFEHLHLKRLVIDNKLPFPMSTFERVLRYTKYGYQLCRESKMKLVKALRELSEREVEVSESLYNGAD
jgi:hypothetical protein